MNQPQSKLIKKIEQTKSKDIKLHFLYAMIQKLGNNTQVRIPFKTIFKSEKYMLHRLYDSLSTGHNYIGQCKMSQRMTYITLALLFGLVEQPRKNKIYYICESKQRALEVKEIVQKLRQFYKKNDFQQSASQQRTSLESLDKDFNLQKSQIVILQNFFHKQVNLLKDYPNDKYICILSIKEYFAEIFQQKVHHKGAHVLKSDYMLIETVAYDEIVETCISGWMNQIVIRRAFIQHKKLEVYYHQRDDKRRIGEKNQYHNKVSNDGSRHNDSLKRRSSNSSIEKDISNSFSQSKQSSKGHSIFHSNKQPQERQWNISEIEKRIQEVYMAKKQILLKQGRKKNGTEIEQEKVDPMKKLSFEEEALMALETIGYLINYFQNLQVITRQSNKTGKDQVSTEESSSEKMIEEMEKKMLIKRDKLKRLHSIFKRFIELYPPIIHPQTYLESNMFFRKGRNRTQPYYLSTKHILQLTKFVKDLILFNETFDEKYSECIEVSKSCFRQREKPSFFELRIKCLNQPLLTEMILEFNENFIVLMNNGISLEFYSSIFKPKILMSEVVPSIIEQQNIQNDKSFKFCFDAPTTISDHIFNNIYGLNVTITPSQDNLKIPDITSKEDAEHDSLIVKAYGVLLHDLCEVISDGIVVYFPNTSIIQKFKQEWTKNEDIFKKINQVKRVFEETELQETNERNIQEYKKVCDIGRGGIYFIAANGGMAKYSQLYGHYSRCVVFAGIPKNIEKKKEHLSQKEKEEKKKKQNYFNLKEAELETFYGLKTTAKCLSNTINCNLQPKSVIFADVSYNKQSSKKWFPFIQQGSLNTSEAIDKVKKFHQHMEKRYEEGIQWEVGKAMRKRSFGKSK